MSAFTREYVEELRREAQRKGARIRELTAELEAKTAELEAMRRGRDAGPLIATLSNDGRLQAPHRSASGEAL